MTEFYLVFTYRWSFYSAAYKINLSYFQPPPLAKFTEQCHHIQQNDTQRNNIKWDTQGCQKDVEMARQTDKHKNGDMEKEVKVGSDKTERLQNVEEIERQRYTEKQTIKEKG